jgi:hypothetical protein
MRVLAGLLALAITITTAPVRAAGEAPPPDDSGGAGRTPPRLSFADGEVSFWRPGAPDWAPAQVNTPLAPGDELYAGDASNLELQIGPRAFVRTGALTQLSLQNQEPDFLQFTVTTGHLSLDLRGVTAGHSIEVDTPNAAFTIERTGYYRVDVDESTTTFIARRGGRAAMTPGGGEPTSLAPSEEVVVTGTDAPTVETYVAPELDNWDHWNYDRTDHLIEALSARYVPAGVYGADALDHYGSWRVVSSYGPVWVPEGVAATWTPYSTGRWIWDPYYGWTWIDEAPWGWAPYHYGRWVYVDDYWAWAPGPVVVAPVYAPALVAFFGGGGLGAQVGIGVPPIGWVALGWGEPCVPWWGPAGFIGSVWWGGWGGPRVVNNVVINRTTIVNARNINVYRNVDVRNAVVVVRRDRFGRDRIESSRLANIDPHRLEPIHGQLAVKPTAESLVPASGRAARPPDSVLQRRVVATRAPHDSASELQAIGLRSSPSLNAPTPRLVPAPRRPQSSSALSARPPFGQGSAPERARPALPPRFEESPHREPAPVEHSERATVEPQPRRPVAPEGRDVAPRPAAPGVQPLPRVGQPRVEVPQPPTRPLPGEPANRVYPGHVEERPHHFEAPSRPAVEPHAPRTAAPPSSGAGGRGPGRPRHR